MFAFFGKDIICGLLLGALKSFCLQLEWEELQRLTNWRLEREQGRMDVTEDMSEDLSEGEKGDAVSEMVQNETPKAAFQRTISNLEVWSEDKKERKLYIILIRYPLF